MSKFWICFVCAGALIAQVTPERHDGFLPFYWDARKGQLLLEIPPGGGELLYGSGLAGGAGLLEISLDRGEMGDEWRERDAAWRSNENKARAPVKEGFDQANSKRQGETITKAKRTGPASTDLHESQAPADALR